MSVSPEDMKVLKGRGNRLAILLAIVLELDQVRFPSAPHA